MAAVTICSDFGAQKIKSDTVSPSMSHEVVGPDARVLVFWKLSFRPTFSIPSFAFIKRLFSYYSLSAIRVVSSAYLRLLIFLPEILISPCVSSSPAFLMMYSAYKLNKQGDNIQPWRTPFPIWNQSVVPCPVLTIASWPAYRFLKRQVRCLSFLSYIEFLVPNAGYTQDIQTGKNCLTMCVGVGVAGNVTGLLLYSMESGGLWEVWFVSKIWVRSLQW